jgi:hypothetical protein
VAALKDQASMFVSAGRRWFWQNECPAELRRWFCETPPAPGGGELRTDQYLLLTDQSEISIKRRGETPDVEIKGLVATLRNERGSFAPHVELWCKWRVRASAQEITEKVIVRKVRWLRTYDASSAAIVEIPLQLNERPLSGAALPQQGCNVELTKILLDGDPRQWWTLGFEAFGDLDSAPVNLHDGRLSPHGHFGPGYSLFLHASAKLSSGKTSRECLSRLTPDQLTSVMTHPGGTSQEINRLDRGSSLEAVGPVE